MPAAPATSAIDKNYFKSPAESIEQYNTRINQYNAAKPPATPTPKPEVPQSIVDNAKTNPSTTSPTGKDVFGNPVNTPTEKTPSTSDTSTTDTNQQKLTDEQAQRAQADAEYQSHSQQVQQTIENIQNGTTPLSPGQQAQVDGLKQQFKALVDAQTIQNTGASGLGNIRGYQKGAAEYDPAFQVKTIGAIVTAGQNKIADLNIKMASAVAQLTQSFHDNDIKAVTDAWKIYQDAATEHADTLQKTIDDTQAAIKSAQDESQFQQSEADKEAQYGLDVAKFNQTGDQNAFDNALKAEQEKFDRANKAAIQSETARHDKATEAIAAFNAGMGAGGGQSSLGVPSAQITANGNPDPVSQKAVLDGITQKYGPMTAIAIKGIADYTMNPADFSVRTSKGSMTKETAVTLAKMYDPTYNDANYSVRAAYLKNLASSQTGTVGSAINAANKSINHLTTFATIMNHMATGGPGSRNSNTLAQANTAALGVSEELAKFFKGSGTVDVGSIEAWKSQINPNQVQPQAVKGTVQSAIDLLGGQLETLSEQYSNTMGKSPTTDFLGPSARASLSSLKDQGYTVDIPGINYTNKDAYLKNGGSPDALSSAYQRLVDANDPDNPPTPENVLELAQMQ